MKRKREVTRTMGFDEAVNLVDCPYCHVEKGDPCRQRGVKILDYPHKSRAIRAFDVRDGKQDNQHTPARGEGEKQNDYI